MTDLVRGLHGAWRRLPPGLRRRLYERATAALASDARPTPATPPRPAAPFVVAGALRAPTGLGEAARLTLRGLVALGEPVSAIDLTAGLRQTPVAPLPDLPPAPAGPGTLLLFAQPPNVAHALALIGRRLLRDKRRVGCWVWDLEAPPPSWVAATRFVHEVAAPSAFAVRAFRTAFACPVRRLIYPLGDGRPPKRTPDPAAAFVFGAALDLGSTAARKNPAAVVEAFRQAFAAGDRVRLSLKIRDEGADPAAAARLRALAAGAAAPVEILSGDFAPEDLERWWRTIDVLVSLHRSEGFGLLPAEAMLRALPVIATDWSATAEFVSPEAGWPVPARLTPVVDPTGRYQLPGARWAEPSIPAAAAAMRAAAADRTRAEDKGRRAAQALRRTFSLEAFRDQLFREADAEEAGAGEAGAD